MSVSIDMTATLRAQEHGHQPIICVEAAGFKGKASPSAGNIGFVRGVSDFDSRSGNSRRLLPARQRHRPKRHGWMQRKRRTRGGVSYTLNTIDRHAVCYAIDPLSSNSMKSKNPHSGFHETEVCKCLDTRCLEPTCNQGGVIVCENMGGGLPESGNEQRTERDNTSEILRGGYSLNYINPIVYDARGNGNGKVAPTLTGDHQNRITDYTAVLIQERAER